MTVKKLEELINFGICPDQRLIFMNGNRVEATVSRPCVMLDCIGDKKVDTIFASAYKEYKIWLKEEEEE